VVELLDMVPTAVCHDTSRLRGVVFKQHQMTKHATSGGQWSDAGRHTTLPET